MEEENNKNLNEQGKKFNPFFEYGIIDYEQYKKYPFLESKSISQLRNKLNNQINSNFMFQERLLILGDVGSGKTSALFFVHDLLKESKKCNVIILSNLFTDAESFEILSQGEKLRELSKSPTYILVDFPDMITSNVTKKFLDYLWTIMASGYQNVSFIFALNKSHLTQSLNFSEVLGKFNKFRIERMNLEEAKELISLRLGMTNSPEFFDEQVYELIYKYSKGIPRNIICASMNLFDQYFDCENVNESMASEILKDSYANQIINDRIEDINERQRYKRIVEIIKDNYGGKSESQEVLVNAIKEDLCIGRNKTMSLISNLSKFGVLNLAKGGERNTKKIYLT